MKQKKSEIWEWKFGEGEGGGRGRRGRGGRRRKERESFMIEKYLHENEAKKTRMADRACLYARWAVSTHKRTVAKGLQVNTANLFYLWLWSKIKVKKVTAIYFYSWQQEIKCSGRGTLSHCQIVDKGRAGIEAIFTIL